MTQLNTAPNIAAPDDVNQMLIDAHDGLNDEQSMRLNAKLILLLSNHIGDQDVIAQAIASAKAAQ